MIDAKNIIDFKEPDIQQTKLSYYKTKKISTNVFRVSDRKPVFLFYGSNPSFYHTIVEELGQALYLKKKIANLRVIVCYESTKQLVPVVSELQTMFPFLEIMHKPIDQYDAVLISNLVYCHYENNIFLKRAFKKTIVNKWSHFHIHKFFTPELRRAFLQFTDKSNKLNNHKIYIKFDVKKGSQHGRKYLPEDILMLEKFFAKHNFEIFDPTSVSLLKQIQKISKAKTVVSLSGSNSTHCLWMKTNATFVLMNLASPYNFPHDDLIKNSCNLIFLEESASAVPYRLKEDYSYLI